MGCLLVLLALISPRLVLFLLWIFSDVLSRAFDSWIIPLLGFFLLPWTTLAYAAFWDCGSGRHVTGFERFFGALVESGRWEQGRAMRLAKEVAACGPALAPELRAARGRIGRPQHDHAVGD